MRKNKLEQIYPLPQPCVGSAKSLDELVITTKLAPGTCPQVSATQQVTYHCTVVDEKVGKMFAVLV